MIDDCREKGATPILVSLTPRNEWPGGKIERRDDSYGKWYREVVKETGVEFVDLPNISADFLDKKFAKKRLSDDKEKAKADALKAYAAKQVPRKGEIHAVWDHSGCGLYPGDWGKTIALLKASRVTDLFVNVAGAGFAHYPSNVLPRSKTFEQEGDQLAQCLAAAKGSGIRVHAWVLCFTATRSTPDRLEIFRKKGWRLKDRDGRLTEYLDPSNKEVRDHLIAAIDELQAKYGIDGVHLDFVRWYERSEKPNDATDTITRFVAEARRHVKRP